jgi:hypothetical protein
VVTASKKKEAPFKENQGLGNFVDGGWDYARFACLLEKLRDDTDPMPCQKEVAMAVEVCRSVRNKTHHSEHN